MTDKMDEIDKELRRISIGLDKLLHRDNRSNTDKLVDFGFTLREAKSWLKREPDFHAIRRKETEDKSDGDVPVPAFFIILQG